MARRIPLGELCISKVATLPNGFDDIIDYIDISSVDNESKAIVAHQEIEGTEAPSRARQLLEVGDVLVSTVRPNLNAVAFVETAYKYTLVGSTGYCVLRTKEGVDNRFVFYFCQSPYFIEDMTAQATGASYPAVTASIVRKATVPDYSLEKQKEIAQCLDSITTLLSLRKQQLAKLDELVKARFIELFGDPDENPMNWETAELDQHLDIVGGFAFKSDGFTATGIPVLRIGNINSGHFLPVNMVFWPDDPTLDRYKMYPGDLVMSLTGTVGKDDYGNVCILSDEYSEYYLNQRNAKLAINATLNKYYLSEMLKFSKIKKRLTGISRGVRQANISNRDILALCVPIPPIELQEQFAAFVEQTDKSKFAVQQSIEKMETLKKSLMQQYFG